MAEKQPAEVIVSYETVFDLVRREKSRSELQQIPSDFMSNVCDYLRAKKTLLHRGFDEHSSADEKQRLILHIQNMKKLLRQLYDFRETKIMHLAQNKVRTGDAFVDMETMLPEERELFGELATCLETKRKEILGQMTQAAADRQLIEAQSNTLAPMPPVLAPTAALMTPKKPATPESQVIEQAIASKLRTVRFLQSVPKFVGRDLEVYGPYDQEQIASLPTELAKILVEKGRAEEYEMKL